jgi:hypothetical protein
VPTDWTADELTQIGHAIEPNPARRWSRRWFPPSPRGLTSAGLQDYRQLSFEGGSRLDVQDADFSQARSRTNEHGVDIGLSLWSWRSLRVRFDGAGVFHRLDGIFDNCSFDGIKTERCAVVGLFRDCTFSQASLKRAHLESNFVRCRFERTQLHVASWSSFEDCTFVDCRIHSLFSEVAAFVAGGKPVTFSMLSSGRLRPGETAAFFTSPELLRGWPP